MKVVIVGGVAGGAGVAARLRRNDETAEIVLLDKGGYISFANCGMPYYIGGAIPEEIHLLIHTPESFYQRFRVDIRVRNEVLSINCTDKTVLVKDHITGKTYLESYDKLVLSPGARPVIPRINIAGDADVFTLRGMEDAQKIKEYIDQKKPKTAVILGGGLIGLEMAENFTRKGIGTTVVESSNHVIRGLDMDMAYEVHNHLRSNGVRVCKNSKAATVEKGFVLLENGEKLSADCTLISVGVKPDTRFLKSSGIQLGEKGEIVVDEELNTSQPDVFALGDAIGVQNICSGDQDVIPLAGPANKQARILADRICGKRASYRGTQGSSIAQVFNRTVALTGLGEDALLALGTDYQKVILFSYSNATYYPGFGFMTIKILFSKRTGKLYGAQILGTKGVDKHIDLLAVAVRQGLTIYDLQEMECVYAPPYSSAKNPVNMAGFIAENILTGHSDPVYVEEVAELTDSVKRLDVRTPQEYAKGCIPGAINIPLNDLREHLDSLDKEYEWVVNCQTGLRSYIAERILKQNGFRVRNLIGGYRLYAQMASD